MGGAPGGQVVRFLGRITCVGQRYFLPALRLGGVLKHQCQEAESQDIRTTSTHVHSPLIRNHDVVNTHVLAVIARVTLATSHQPVAVSAFSPTGKPEETRFFGENPVTLCPQAPGQFPAGRRALSVARLGVPWNAWNPTELCRWPNVGLFGIAEAKCTRIDERTACSTVPNLLRSNCSLAGGVAPIRCGESGGYGIRLGLASWASMGASWNGR